MADGGNILHRSVFSQYLVHHYRQRPSGTAEWNRSIACAVDVAKPYPDVAAFRVESSCRITAARLAAAVIKIPNHVGSLTSQIVHAV